MVLKLAKQPASSGNETLRNTARTRNTIAKVLIGPRVRFCNACKFLLHAMEKSVPEES